MRTKAELAKLELAEHQRDAALGALDMISWEYSITPDPELEERIRQYARAKAEEIRKMAEVL